MTVTLAKHGPYHAAQALVLVFHVPINVQGQLVRTQKRQGQTRTNTVDST